MKAIELIPAEPPPELRFRRRLSAAAALVELWRARGLVRTLTERDLRARYKQAILGFAWAIVTPVTMVVAFSLFFQRVAKVNTAGAPYPLFAYLGLLSWTFFSGSLAQGGTSILANMSLLNKVYCPREVFPISAIATNGIDTLTSALALLLLFPIYGFAPRAASLWIPVLLLVQVAFTLGVTLIVSSVTVYLRDLRHAVPIMLQLGLFASPVAYGMNVIPMRLRGWYSLVNPLAPVIDGYRRTVLQGRPPEWSELAIAAVVSALALVVGFALFKKLETGIADVA